MKLHEYRISPSEIHWRILAKGAFEPNGVPPQPALARLMSTGSTGGSRWLLGKNMSSTLKTFFVSSYRHDAEKCLSIHPSQVPITFSSLDFKQLLLLHTASVLVTTCPDNGLTAAFSLRLVDSHSFSDLM